MRVIYFSKCSDYGPSSRYRIYQFLPYLQAAGIHCSVRPLFGTFYFSLLETRVALLCILGKVIYIGSRFLKRLWDIATMGQPDLVVIEGQLFPYCPPVMERLLSWTGQNLVIEFDDAIYLTHFHRRKMPAVLRVSSGALVGNSVLAEYARHFTPTVHVIPTVVDTARFKPQEPDRSKAQADGDGVRTIVWIGLAYNFPYLDALVPVLRDIQRRERVRFRVISSRPPAISGVEVEFKPWNLVTEVVDLQACHIGVMPLPNNEWARGKCGLKLLQYMAVGLPVVASPVGVNGDIVRDGENGFWAHTEDEWYARLLSLCRDSTLRGRMGNAARHTVEERYSLHVWGPRLAAEYKAIAQKGNEDHRRPSSTPNCTQDRGLQDVQRFQWPYVM